MRSTLGELEGGCCSSWDAAAKQTRVEKHDPVTSILHEALHDKKNNTMITKSTGIIVS